MILKPRLLPYGFLNSSAQIDAGLVRLQQKQKNTLLENLSKNICMQVGTQFPIILTNLELKIHEVKNKISFIFTPEQPYKNQLDWFWEL